MRGRHELQEPRRVTFLDGLRGVAALQVVALHYVTAFLPAIGMFRPAIARHGWEGLFIGSPLFVMFDGYASVYVFFLISGAALTYAFAVRPFAIGSGVVRRLVRLGVPMAASVIFAACLLFLVPSAHVTAGQLSGSVGWLSSIGPPQIAIWPVLREIALGLVAGHGDHLTTLLPWRLMEALHLLPLEQSFDAPLWTLHVELYGSFLVLGLVALRALVGRLWHAAVCILLLAFLATHPLGLFVIGHLAAPVLVSSSWNVLLERVPVRMFGVLAILGGLAMSRYVGSPGWLIAALVRHARYLWLPGAFDEFHAQSAVGAVLLFLGVVMLAPLQRVLTSPLLRWLGQISFSLYLTHFPILFTLAALTFVADYGHPAATLVATLVGLTASLVVACLFERWVDRPAVRLSRRIVRPWTLHVRPDVQPVPAVKPL